MNEVANMLVATTHRYDNR